MKEKEINLFSFLSAVGLETQFEPSEEAFKATEINAVMVKYYLATYYDMKKEGLVTDQVDSLLKDNVQAEAWSVIENCNRIKNKQK